MRTPCHAARRLQCLDPTDFLISAARRHAAARPAVIAGDRQILPRRLRSLNHKSGVSDAIRTWIFGLAFWPEHSDAHSCTELIRACPRSSRRQACELRLVPARCRRCREAANADPDASHRGRHRSAGRPARIRRSRRTPAQGGRQRQDRRSTCSTRSSSGSWRARSIPRISTGCGSRPNSSRAVRRSGARHRAVRDRIAGRGRTRENEPREGAF